MEPRILLEKSFTGEWFIYNQETGKKIYFGKKKPTAKILRVAVAESFKKD